ncbi:epoxyqueuosine reductase QueH [Helicobacter canis]|uniref:Epoxyqueuosine reductase QueH n=1 Tax=Helicobacter canis TaxID=29419 RepID=A0A5M9QST6_9HELI|nr:epoxyqueuosine reductase QueH [Helicobacter canis]KAA8710095.1 epoxyqueuosine reductase QueH [Helicobacter canis]
MLVHICCSVDSHYFLSELQKAYPQESFVGFFYNPNIHPKAEHDLRLSDVRRSCSMLKIPLIEGSYELENWLSSVRGQEDEPEKGARCSTCFDVRLKKSAEIAKLLGERTFTTTLLSSPMKEQETLYQQGDIIAQNNDLNFIKINVRKNGGVQKQNELAKRDNLYRQNYCGCQFALSKQRVKQDRLSLEMISELGGRALPGSIEERQKSFALRNTLESTGKSYILTQKKLRVWRLLQGKVSYNEKVIYSYILAHSDSRATKNTTIVWGNITLESLLDSRHIMAQDNFKNMFAITPKATIRLGFSKKDDSVFVCLKDVNALLNTQYECVLDLIYNPIAYELELLMRSLLCGSESINPIIIIDEISENLTIDIKSVFQDERIFQTIFLS